MPKKAVVIIDGICIFALEYLGLDGCGIFTNHDANVMDEIKTMAGKL